MTEPAKDCALSDPSFIERLEEEHEFPGPYTTKIIGRNRTGFRADIETTIMAALQFSQSFELSERLSKNERHVSLTVQFEAQSAEQVLQVYGEIQRRDDIEFLL